MLQLVDSSRDFEDEATADRADAFKLAALGNLALCDLGAGEAARAAEWCDKALKLEPENAKVGMGGRLCLLRGEGRARGGDGEECTFWRGENERKGELALPLGSRPLPGRGHQSTHRLRPLTPHRTSSPHRTPHPAPPPPSSSCARPRRSPSRATPTRPSSCSPRRRASTPGWPPRPSASAPSTGSGSRRRRRSRSRGLGGSSRQRREGGRAWISRGTDGEMVESGVFIAP
jgi:hypothetical protein